MSGVRGEGWGGGGGGGGESIHSCILEEFNLLSGEAEAAQK